MTMPLLLLLGVLALEPAESEIQQAQSAARLKFLEETAAAIEIRSGKNAEVKLDHYPQSLLRWNSAQSRVVDAATVLWTIDSRPQVIGGMWIKDGIGLLELHSLSQEPLQATILGNQKWAPSKAGITWQPMPGDASVAETRGARLRQLKSCARRFAIHAVKTAPDYDEGSIWRFRMLDQPIYRYEEPSKRDGAIFAFVQGTDPEAFVLFESRPENEHSSWYFALVPSCVWELHAELDGREVWNRPKESRQRNPDNVYYSAGPFRVNPELLPRVK